MKISIRTSGLEILISTLLLASFLLSGLSYLNGDLLIRASSPAILFLLFIFTVFQSRGQCFARIPLIAWVTLLFFSAQTILSLISNQVESSDNITLSLTTVTFLSACCIGAQFGSRPVIYALCGFGIILLCALPLMREQLLQLATTAGARLMTEDLHPNTVGYTALSLGAVGAALLLSPKLPYMACGIILFIMSLGLLWLTESRGNLVGLFASSTVVAFFFYLRAFRSRRFLPIFATIALLFIGVLTLILDPFEVRGFVFDKMAVYDVNRGIDSGYTGRTVAWQYVISSLSPSDWLIGSGYRSSDTIFNGPIDNSYVVMLAELGIFSVLLVVVWFLIAIFKSWQSARSSSASDTPIIGCFECSILIGVLVACIFCRYLIAIGNPTSLATLIILTSASARRIS